MRLFQKLFLLAALTLNACSNNQEQESRSEVIITDSTRADDSIKPTKTHFINNDTLMIDNKSAVFYQPDSLQMERRMKEVGEEDFRAGADDYIFYINTSAEYLEKKGLTVLDAKSRKYLKFISANNQVHIIKLDSLDELWGMYLFDPKKQPYAADITIIEEEYAKYFK